MNSIASLSICSRITRGLAVATIALSAAVSALHAADPAISIFTSVGPNGNTSPNNTAYFQNALIAIQNRDSNGGFPAPLGTGPAGYSYSPSAQTNQSIISQGFNSWMGVADPGPIASTFGPAYSGEFGNMLYFGLDVRRFGDPSTSRFRLADLRVTTQVDGFTIDSFTGSDLNANSYRLFTYNNGVNTAGGVTDVTALGPTALVDEIIYRGASPFFIAAPQPGDPNNQFTLNENIAGLNSFNGPGQTPNLSVRYTIFNTTAANTASVQLTPSAIVPEPGSLAAAIAGGIGLLVVSRKKLARRRHS